jgi:hypothetical protein
MNSEASKLQNQMVQALTRELEIAKRVSSGERSNKLLAGKRRSSGKNCFIYEFEELIGFPPEEGVQISFAVKDKATNGRYLGEVDAKFLFEVEGDLGAEIDEATVVSDPLFLLQRQIDLLSEDEPFKSAIALSSLDLAPKPKPEPLNFPDLLSEDLNFAQASSLKVLAGSSVTYIWGPPGTGKTTTLGSVVAGLALLGKKVLLVSNTNLALDTALEKCIDRLGKVTEIDEGVMLRLGSMVKGELIRKYDSKIELDKVYEKKSEPIKREVVKISSNLQKLKDAIGDLEQKSKKYSEMLEIACAPEKLNERLLELQKQEEQIKEAKRVVSGKISKLESELIESESKNGITRLFAGARKPGQVRYDLDQRQRDLKQNQVNYDRLISEKLEFKELETKTKAEAGNAEQWLKKNDSFKKANEESTKLKSEAADLSQEIEKLNEDLANLKKNLLINARVIACTAYRPLLDKDVSGIQFDCVVVDEASMLPLPLYYCSAYRATERIVVAGDFRQLPPIVRVGSQAKPNSKESEADEQHRQILIGNPFTRSSVKSRLTSASDHQDLVALREQYRMREPISDLISSTFYPEHTLKTVNDQRDKPTPWGNETFLIFDTTALNPESGQVNGRSRRNIQHALVAQSLCQALFESGWELDATSQKSFGLVTPYASQSRFIENMLTANAKHFIKGGVSTVHRFQGNERDLMIIDLTKVTSDVAPSLGANFLGNPEPLSSQNAMWNVAISRARQHVLFIVDLSTIERDATALISNIIRRIDRDFKVIDAADVLNANSLNQRIPKESKGSIAWFTSDGFYSEFERDLNRAKNRVLIVSPFTSEGAVSKWMPTLRDLVAKNVAVSIFTKPEEEKMGFSDAAKVHGLLKDTFSTFRTIPKMHEKLAVIDEKTVWLGSLNILSHHSASEIMVRIESPDFAQSLIDEYQNQRITGGNQSSYTRRADTLVAGEKCKRSGCGGVIVSVPGGYSKAKQKRYDAFKSCSRYRETGCKGE